MPTDLSINVHGEFERFIIFSLLRLLRLVMPLVCNQKMSLTIVTWTEIVTHMN